MNPTDFITEKLKLCESAINPVTKFTVLKRFYCSPEHDDFLCYWSPDRAAKVLRALKTLLKATENIVDAKLDRALRKIERELGNDTV
jgi:hypothetical protein